MYIDVAILVIVALFAIIGLVKGFFKTVISLVGWVLSLVIVFFLARTVANWLLGVELVQGLVFGKEASMYAMIHGALPESLAALPAGSSEEVIKAALGDGFASWIITPFITILTSSSIAAAGATVSQGIALVLTDSLFLVIVGILLFIAVRLVMMIFTAIGKAITRNKVVNGVNRLFGFILGAVRGFAYSCVLLVIAGYLAMSGFLPFLQPYKEIIEDPNATVIAGPVSGFLMDKISGFLEDGDVFDKILEIVQGNGALEDSTDDDTNEEETLESAADVRLVFDDSFIETDGAGAADKTETKPTFDFPGGFKLSFTPAL